MYHLRNLINRTTVPSDPEKTRMLPRTSCCCCCIHVVAAATVMQSINPTETVADLAKLIIVNHVQLPRIDDQLPRNVTTRYISMRLNYFHWGYCGMDFTMIVGRGMETEYSGTGRLC